MVSSGHAFHPQDGDSGGHPSALAVTPLEVFLRPLPPFPVYILAGAVDGNKGGGEDASADCGNRKVAQPGVGVYQLLLRAGCVERHPGEL